MTLSLENPDAKIICFKKQNDFFINMANQDRKPEDQIKSDHIRKAELDQYIENDAKINAAEIPNLNENEQPEERSDNLCSPEQVDSRLDICKTCEHFKNQMCLLCGCTVVREANFNNKLAHKDASCPVNKWGPIKN